MKTFNFLLTSLLLAISSFAQIKQAASVDSIFAEWDKPGVPGCALGIIKDGKLIYAKGYGMANLEYDIPNSPNSVFRIGSTSKQFTAACVIRLVEQGKLKLDNTLDEFYPGFPPYAKKITIRHLLHHTSGIRDYLVLSYLKGLGDDDYYTDEDVMQWLVHQSDLNFEPGEEHLYSNSGYWLLGQIVNKAAGMPMADYAQQEIFKPLGMTNTHFHTDHNLIVKHRATGYTPTEEDGYEICMTTLGLIGDGGIFTTINDIKKWDDAFYKSDVLSKNFWDMMTEKGVLNNGDTIDYACGLMISTHKGLKAIQHGGAFVGFRAEILRFPEQHFSVAILANRADANPTRMAYKVADIFLKGKYSTNNKEIPKKVAEHTTATPAVVFTLQQLTGKFSIEPGVDMDIQIKNDSLNITQMWNNASYNVAATKGNTYHIPGEASVSFTFSELQDGMAQTMTVYQDGTETICRRKKEVDLSGVDLKEYAGNYYSPELDINYSILEAGGNLQLKVGKNAPSGLGIIAIDEYSSEGTLLHFKRDNGKISGFELDAGRVKSLKFAKK